MLATEALAKVLDEVHKASLTADAEVVEASKNLVREQKRQEFQKTYADLRKQKPKEAIVLEVHRDNRENTIRIEPPQ